MPDFFLRLVLICTFVTAALAGSFVEHKDAQGRVYFTGGTFPFSTRIRLDIEQLYQEFPNAKKVSNAKTERLLQSNESTKKATRVITLDSTNEATFLSQMTHYYLETFTAPTVTGGVAASNDLTFSSNGFTYTIGTSASPPLVMNLYVIDSPSGIPNDLAISTNDSTESLIVFSFVSRQPYCIGAIIYGTDNNGGFVDNTRFQITVTTASETYVSSILTTTTAANFAGNNYYGFCSSTDPITELRIASLDSSVFATIDNLVIGDKFVIAE